ncbi:efflux RND transporter periplasmic adaptor subunit [Thiorhodococcus minor]|uniref:HlyD family efflux transporter periplasmic adaptor subunit n=1 Tax=Thiorhodococcus minor TaxID=57489 RepID=A0A6M0JT70_9GAMM|nr:HlyD family efflux transporter periplasmic adaptor subunit [Thiorhodococcus minor]NEV60698.1 HlyD family efflux transporter periplasmic adaptor subunit [Thiorhodococcus minor]
MARRYPALVRRSSALLAVSMLIGAVVLGFRPTPRLVDTEPVARGHLAVTVEAEGRTRVIDRYRISAPIAGVVRRLTLDVGDAVAAGDVVAVLDALAAPALDKRSRQQAQARVAAAEAELAATREAVKAAQAAEAYASSELARLDPLGRQGMVSRTELEKARSDARRATAELASARFRVSTAQHELESARTQLTFAGEPDGAGAGVVALRAPVGGRVLRRELESAHVAQPGDPILEIGDPARLEVEVDVLSADAVRIAPDMRVWLERWGESEPLEGRVERIEPTAFTKISALGVEEQRVWVIVGILSPHDRWARLGDAYRVNARFVLWEADDVLKVPTSSLFRHRDAWAVFALVDGRARLRPVRVGQRGTLYSQVLEGVVPEDRVIVHPDREISDGARARERAAH